jgi:hypothetical protein
MTRHEAAAALLTCPYCGDAPDLEAAMSNEAWEACPRCWADACPRCEVGTTSQQTWTSDGRTIHGGMECEACGWTETDGQPCAVTS